jgi:hypothetical protein
MKSGDHIIAIDQAFQSLLTAICEQDSSMYGSSTVHLGRRMHHDLPRTHPSSTALIIIPTVNLEHLMHTYDS